MQQGRLSELLFGLYCVLTLRPAKVRKAMHGLEMTDLVARAQEHFQARNSSRLRWLSEANRHLDRADEIEDCRIHGFVEGTDGALLGEYHDHSARMVSTSGKGVRVFSPYAQDSWVRHIHLVHLHDGELFVATGDSRKYLDPFSFEAGELHFKRRILKRNGGFTAACSIGNKLYLGTDFSGRPNCIYCLQTGEKFAFPKPAFYQYCILMLPVDDRRILCLNMSTPFSTPKKTLSLFDPAFKQYLFCEEQVGPEFPL